MVSIYPSGDTYIDIETPTTNYSSSTLLHISKRRGPWDRRKRILFQFDISSLAGVIITSTIFNIYWEFSDVASRGKPLNIRRTTTAWSPSTVTYNTQPTYAGGPFGLMYLGNWSWKQSSDIKALLQAAVDASETEFGLEVDFQNESDNDDHLGRCHSIENTSKPYIVVTYTSPAPPPCIERTPVDRQSLPSPRKIVSGGLRQPVPKRRKNNLC